MAFPKTWVLGTQLASHARVLYGLVNSADAVCGIGGTGHLGRLYGNLPQPSPFPLPWSHYVRLLSVKNRPARSFYETEPRRGLVTIW
jgi:hypothetical protein